MMEYYLVKTQIQIPDKLFVEMSKKGMTYRRIYDLRIAYTLQSFGVTEFATCNLKDFQSTGFKKVWNPIL